MSSHGHHEKDSAKEHRGPVEVPPRDSSSDSPTPADETSSTAAADPIQKLLAEKQELTETLLRRQADFENYRKRVEKERHQDRHRGVELLIEQILPVLDAFDRALSVEGDSASAEYLKGFELIRRQLSDALVKQGLTRIECVGKEFNPHFHHAIESVETSEYPEGTVIGEMQPGYMFHERILRPAMVRVASAPEKQSARAHKRDN
jgi:molecular chaperone GrpE